MRKMFTALVCAAVVVSGATPAWAADEAPTLTSTGLTDGQRVGARYPVIPTWTGDITAVETVVAGRLTSSPPGLAKSGTLHLHFLPAENDTDVDVTVRVRNAAGLADEATNRIHVDLTPVPSPLHVTPTPGSGQRGTFTVAVLDLPADVAQLRAFDGRTELARLTAAPWTFKVTVPSPEVTIMVTDQAGNLTQRNVRYPDDRTGPWIYADFDPSFADYVPEGTGTMWVTYEDQSAVRKVEFHDGNVVINIPKSDFRFRYDFGRTSGQLAAEFWAWDEWGNKSVTPFSGWVDASAPVVTKMAPVGNILVHGSRVSSTITATDAVGVKSALLVGAPVDTTSPYTGSIPAGKDGRLMLRWYVADQFGHTAQFTRFVTVDNTKPGLRIVSAPANGAKVKGAVRVVAAASDRNGINRVELIINGKIVSAGTGTFSINTAKYGKTLKVQFRAWDRAGNWQVTPVRTWRR